MTVNLPDFARRRLKLEPITFAPVQRVFKPQREVTITRDLSGWVDRRRRVKFHLPKGWHGYIDAETADQWIVKGYAKGQLSRTYSDDERAELLADVTVLNLGHRG